MTTIGATYFMLRLGLAITIVVSTPMMLPENMKNSDMPENNLVNDTFANSSNLAAFANEGVSRNVFEPDKIQSDILLSANATTNMDDGLNANKNDGVIEFGPVASDDTDEVTSPEEPISKSFSDKDMEYDREQMNVEIPDLSDILKNKNKDNPFSYDHNKMVKENMDLLPGQYYSPVKESKDKEFKDISNERLELSESFVPMETLFNPFIKKTIFGKLTVVFDALNREDNEGHEMAATPKDPLNNNRDHDLTFKLKPTPADITDEGQEDTSDTDEETVETTEPLKESTKMSSYESEIDDSQEAYDFADESNDPDKYDARRKVVFAKPGMEEEKTDEKQIPNYYIPYVPYVD